MDSRSGVDRLLCLTGEIVAELATRPAVLAAFQGGSAAWGRSDPWSDVDLKVIIVPGAHAEVLGVVEATLARGPGIARRLHAALPVPAASQCFFEVRGISTPNLLDVTTFEGARSFPRERHGLLHVFFDRGGVVRQTSVTVDHLALRLLARAEHVYNAHGLFAPFVTKELARGRPADALRYYMDDVDRAVELTRIVHCPERFDFGVRYLREDLPAAESAALERLLFVASAADIADRHRDVCARIGRLYEAFHRMLSGDAETPLAVAS